MACRQRLRRSAAGGPQGKLTGAVKHLYWKAPTAEEVALVGFALEDYVAAPEGGTFYDPQSKEWRYELWAENWPAFKLFNDFSTQWRVGMNGPTGLDYTVFLHELDRRGLSRDEYDDTLGCLRVIEQTALKEIHKDTP